MTAPTPEQVQALAADHTFLGSAALAGAIHDVLADHVSFWTAQRLRHYTAEATRLRDAAQVVREEVDR